MFLLVMSQVLLILEVFLSSLFYSKIQNQKFTVDITQKKTLLAF